MSGANSNMAEIMKTVDIVACPLGKLGSVSKIKPPTGLTLAKNIFKKYGSTAPSIVARVKIRKEPFFFFKIRIKEEIKKNIDTPIGSHIFVTEIIALLIAGE